MAAPTDLQLSASVVSVAIVAFLDIDGEALRYALSPCSLVMPASTILPAANAAFDGQTFTALDPRFISMSPIQHAEGGAQRVDFTVAGTLEFDSDLLTALSDPSRFRGRTASVWVVLLDAAYQPIAAKQKYLGYMAVPSFGLSPDQQSITITTENYLALVGGGAPSRTLLSQKLYDAADNSANVTAGKSDGSSLGPAFSAGGQAIRQLLNVQQR
jgi:hypothetical protein